MLPPSLAGLRGHSRRRNPQSHSLLALSAALLLSTAGLSLAQEVSGGVGAGAGVEISGSSGDTSVDVDADADVDLSLDTNGDGTVDEGETAGGGNSSGGSTGGNTSGGTDLDTDGDGTVSAEEQAAAGSDDDTDSPSGMQDCAAVDMSGMGSMAADDVANISSATSVTIVRLTDCEDDSGSLNSEIESALFGNTAIAAELAQEGIGGGEVLSVTASDGMVTVYVASDDSESGDGSDTSTGGTSTEDSTTNGTTSQ